MRIILTHEQADFDALASLLGAHLLDETAYAVLPNRMNRNLRAFLTIYGVELPFIERRDLPQEPVEAVTLVDTQSMVSIRGVGAGTSVRVIDHHAVRDNLPPDWSLALDNTGAAATLFVEELRDHNGPLSMIQATLMLLGIYEDTGSLTYSRTTPRDLRAAAYLIEQGASLKIASDYINHPLSDAQQALYERLRAELETHHIHGHTVTIACGDATDMDEEISTIAHKLRDLLDPDALFLLINTRGGVQLIARSTTDSIDVAEISAGFGGGGHARAAAALIKNRSAEEVRLELLQTLPRVARPAITVAQIMSHGPQVLAPDASAEDAARRMQRYGYEGYPVVKNGQVIGLLTRRAVDRAIAHKLNLPAASLMEAGEVTVYPTDSLEDLQRRMIDTGWGQIPVVHPETKKIIGIVTRTDLLKTLTSKVSLPGRQNLSEKLASALPEARLALLNAAAREAYEQLDALYMVGGFVRDLLLDRPSLDFDLVVEGDAIALAKSLAARYGGRVTSHARFGTAKWFLCAPSSSDDDSVRELAARLGVSVPAGLPESIDLISARTEFYTHPTALPTVERGSIKLDLHRRDFTINTLALRLDGHHYGELHDYWGGLSDLRLKLVRVLHSLSFVDDPTRILRAVRFEQRFDFQIEERTLQLLKEALSLLDRVSGDRIRHELDHILDEERAVPMLKRLEDLGILAALHPALVLDDWFSQQVESLKRSPEGQPLPKLEQANAFLAETIERKGPALKRALIYILWLIRLTSPRAREILERLKIPRELADEVCQARQLWETLPTLPALPPSGVVAVLDEFSPLALAACLLAVEDPQQRQTLLRYITELRKVSASTDGHDLLRMGLPPGPRYREILTSLRAAWLDGKITSLEEEQAMLQELVGE